MSMLSKEEGSAEVFVPQAAILKDVKASGAAGGGFTSGAWRTRTLNNELDPFGIVSLTGNQFTLQNGTYWIYATSPAYQVDSHQSRLVEDPSGTPTTIAVGSSASTGTGIEITTVSVLSAYFTISGGPKTYELQYRSETSRSAVGSGFPCSFSVSEVYAQVVIVKFNDV